MKLTVLGMNGPYPTPDGACSGYLFQSGDTTIQLDLGTGVLAALTGRMPPEELSALVLSHWHFDHCSDILPLIYRMEGLVAQGVSPLHVYAPVDDNSPIRTIVRSSAAFILHDVAPGETLQIGSVTVKTAPARHPVPAMMMRMEDAGKVFCYTGDTNTMDTIAGFIHGADLLLADGLFNDTLWSEQKPHLSARHCAALAREAGVSRLVITHLSPVIEPAALLKQAREEFIGAELARRFVTYTL